MKLEGYHNTGASNVEDILQHGFKYKYSDEHWLGQGIYFFSDIDTAVSNIDMLAHDEEIKTIAAEIAVDDTKFLDLDIRGNLNAFRKFCSEKIASLKKQGKRFCINESNRKKAMLKYKCFFIDLFKMEKGYEVITKTFAKENPPYAEVIDGINYLGLPFLERYICVSSNEYIVKKNLVEKEWIV